MRSEEEVRKGYELYRDAIAGGRISQCFRPMAAILRDCLGWVLEEVDDDIFKERLIEAMEE